MDLLATYGSDSDDEEITKDVKEPEKPKVQFDLPKPKSNVPLTDLALPEDIIIEDDEPIIDEKEQKALFFAQIEQEEERSFPTRYLRSNYQIHISKKKQFYCIIEPHIFTTSRTKSKTRINQIFFILISSRSKRF
jgi:hypothetical protein